MRYVEGQKGTLESEILLPFLYAASLGLVWSDSVSSCELVVASWRLGSSMILRLYMSQDKSGTPIMSCVNGLLVYGRLAYRYMSFPVTRSQSQALAVKPREMMELHTHKSRPVEPVTSLHKNVQS